MSAQVTTLSSSRIIRDSSNLRNQIARALSVLGKAADNALNGAPEPASSPLPCSADLRAKLSDTAESLTVDEAALMIRFLCQRGITLFWPSVRFTPLDSRIIRLWSVGQCLTEKYVSWHYRALFGVHRAERLWDGLYPSNLGTTYQTARVRKSLGSRRTIVIGQPCSNCSRGRLFLWAHPDEDAAGIRCNADCTVAGPFLSEPWGVEIHRGPPGRTTAESAIWREPTLCNGAGDFLPYQELGCPVTWPAQRLVGLRTTKSALPCATAPAC